MTLEEYKQKLNGIITNPDSAPAEMTELTAALEADFASIASKDAEIEDLNSKINELRETNMKLYLSIGGGSSETEDEEPAEGAAVIDEFMERIFKEGE